jgi:hypothetical protein
MGMVFPKISHLDSLALKVTAFREKPYKKVTKVK